MDKTENRNQGKTRANHAGLSTPLTGIITDSEKAQELVEDAQQFVSQFRSTTFPAIKKFSRENWKQIALVSAGVSILAIGAFMYFNQAAAKKVASNLKH